MTATPGSARDRTSPARGRGCYAGATVRRRRVVQLALGGIATSTVLAPASHAEPDPRDVPHGETGVFPALGYNPDTGLDLGVFVHRARFEPGARPYAWRGRLQIQTSVLAEDGLELPRQEHFLKLDLPGVPDALTRLRGELVWEKQVNAGYYGVGNAAPAADPALTLTRHHHEYRVETFRAEVSAERELGAPSWRAFAGVGLARVDLDTYEDSLLAADVAADGDDGRSPPGVGLYSALTLRVGLVLDRRDHETQPTRGVFHDVVVRAAPALGDGPGWGGVTYTARFYVPLVTDDLVLATRVLGDVAFGDVPLVEQNHYGGLLPGKAFGGAEGLRGIADGRYVGKTKALGSVELRAAFLPFRAFRTPMNLGAALLVDAGRVWSGSLAADPERDGDAGGLHLGAGAGPRLRWGDSLLIRFEVVRCPDTHDPGAGPLMTYLSADSRF